MVSVCLSVRRQERVNKIHLYLALFSSSLFSVYLRLERQQRESCLCIALYWWFTLSLSLSCGRRKFRNNERESRPYEISVCLSIWLAFFLLAF